MQFNIDMSKVVKIVVEKDEKTFIEYTIDNGTIVDVSIAEKETTLEEKVKNLYYEKYMDLFVDLEDKRENSRQQGVKTREGKTVSSFCMIQADGRGYGKSFLPQCGQYCGGSNASSVRAAPC